MIPNSTPRAHAKLEAISPSLNRPGLKWRGSMTAGTNWIRLENWLSPLKIQMIEEFSGITRERLGVRLSSAAFHFWQFILTDTFNRTPMTSLASTASFRQFRTIVAALLGTILPVTAETTQPCRIEIVEKGSGWPVPLVELRTTHNLRFVSDNAGNIAFDAPELMGRETWFDVMGHGYEVPRDAYGSRGVRLTPRPGKTLKVEVIRIIIAKRLGRLTGGGIFAESQKLGLDLQWP